MVNSGATLPMFSIIFGNVLDALGGSPTIAALVHQVNKVSIFCNVATVYSGVVFWCQQDV